MRKCTKCEAVKPFSEFHDNGGRLRAACKVCERERFKMLRRRQPASSYPTSVSDPTITEQPIRRSQKVEKPEPPEQTIRDMLPQARVYIFTYAQNATEVFTPGFQSLLQMQRHRNAELAIVPGKYKNPTSIYSQRMRHDGWWDAELQPYLFNGRQIIGPGVEIRGDISIQPTADRPTSKGFVLARHTSVVLGHPKLQLEMAPTATRGDARKVITTGAITMCNYTPALAGKVGEEHHVYGATIVEVDDDVCYVRSINMLADGSFIDLDTEYFSDGWAPADRALSINYGDLHVDQSDDEVLAATFEDDDSITNILQPRTQIWNDVLDFKTGSHHRRDDAQFKYEKAIGAHDASIKNEVLRAVNFIDRYTLAATEDSVVTRSNHDCHLDRWLLTAPNPRDFDPPNNPWYCEAWTMWYDAFNERGYWPLAFQLAYEKYGEGKARFLEEDEELCIAEVESGMHGDQGVNGSRGTLAQFAKLSVKTSTGHGHTPGIYHGAYRSGVTGKLHMRYNRGPSTWAHAHICQYANSKRCIIFVEEGGRWRLK